MAVSNFFWEEQNLLQEYDAGGTTVAHYVTEPNQYGNVISQRRSGQTHYFHYEAVGSTTELTNESADVTDTRRYKAFGEMGEESGTTTFPFTFVGSLGYYFNIEQLSYYARRRFHNPETGTWMSTDPALDEQDYRYADNMPTMERDPSGQITLACFRRQAIRCGIAEGLVDGQLGLCFLSCVNTILLADIIGPRLTFGDCIDCCMFSNTGRLDRAMGAATRACTLALVIRLC